MGSGVSPIRVAAVAAATAILIVSAVSAEFTAAVQQPRAPANVRLLRDHAAVSQVAVSSIGSTGATISWITAGLADSQVEYGTTALLGTFTPRTSTLLTTHSVVLSGLLSNRLYYFKVHSRDAAGNLWSSLPLTFATVDSGLFAVLSPADTAINLNTTNYSTSPRLMTYTWPDLRVANAVLMKFDFGSLPAGALVHDARLNLALVDSDAFADPTYTIAVHKMIGRNPVISAATGYTSDGATGWTPNTCCSNNVPLAQADIGPAIDPQPIDKMPGYKSWNVTTFVNEWLADPSTNYGLLLNADRSKLADRYRYFASMEHSDPALRPYLRITYTIPPPDTTPPSVSITSPAAGSSVSGTTTLSANASDNVRVSSVQFQVDGVNYGPSLTIAPFSTSWNTTTFSAGSHSVRAIAVDPSGNSTTSAATTVTILDVTAPTVSITAPSSGTVSGTVTVSATATDATGVAGVQFKLDGVNLGGEDTSAPYSSTWNTSTIADGVHTLTAVARDAAGNIRTSAGVSVSVANASSSPAGIAALYPGDAGIEGHPDVVFTEMFEQSSISTMTSRYTNVGHSSGMSFSTNKPSGSTGARSLQMATDTSNTAATLYKTFPNEQGQWYLRYYINYNSSVEYNHTSVWLGGYNPVLSFPNPQAGSKPAGNDRFSTGIEPLSFDNDRWMPYTYWKDMRVSGDGKYWGNVFLPPERTFAMARNRWYCVEAMIKLNNPVSDSNGELAFWVDGQEVMHLGKGFPTGTWNGGTFTESSGGSPFAGFQWRSDPGLSLNWIWLQNYVTSAASTVLFDHVVLARSRVGCLASGAPDTTAPTVSIAAPTGGATVSGSAVTVTANASDNVGIAGVQFKLDGTNLAAEELIAPYQIVWDTTAVPNGQHTLTAIARDAAGNTTTSAAVTVTVSNSAPPPSAGWPNQPAGFTLVSDQPWNQLTGNGWNYLRRSASKDSDIITDATLPFSPTQSLRIIFTPDQGDNHEPGVHWMGGLGGLKEVYTGWWIKTSPNWTCSPAGCGKMTFLFALGGANVYTTLLNPESGIGPPYRVGLRPQWGGYPGNILPNVATTWINPGEWHRIEFYYKWETTPGVSGDGIIRWWVDGVLNGNHTNITYPSASGFNEFQFAPTLQNAPTAEMYMYIDHTRLSRW